MAQPNRADPERCVQCGLYHGDPKDPDRRVQAIVRLHALLAQQAAELATLRSELHFAKERLAVHHEHVRGCACADVVVARASAKKEAGK